MRVACVCTAGAELSDVMIWDVETDVRGETPCDLPCSQQPGRTYSAWILRGLALLRQQWDLSTNDMPTPRTLTMATAYDNRIYVIGGSGGVSHP